MQMPPVAMVADADIFHWAFQAIVLFNRNGEHLCALCGSYNAAVAIRLLHIVVILFQETNIIEMKFLIPLDRSEVG